MQTYRCDNTAATLQPRSETYEQRMHYQTRATSNNIHRQRWNGNATTTSPHLQNYNDKTTTTQLQRHNINYNTKGTTRLLQSYDYMCTTPGAQSQMLQLRLRSGNTSTTQRHIHNDFSSKVTTQLQRYN